MKMGQEGGEAPIRLSAAPLVSIYMPTRNRCDLLQRAVASVLAQDHAALELIVVNDGSTDGTALFLDTIAQSDERVRVIHRPEGKGAPAARNEAIRQSRGRFVTGLDDDDFFSVDRISSFVAAWADLERRSQQPACLYSQTMEIRDGAQRQSSRPESVRFENLFVQNTIGNQIFAPRETFLQAGLFDETLPAWQDLDFFIRVLRGGGVALLLDKATYLYDDYDRGDRISANPSRIRQAWEIVSKKYADTIAQAEFQLFMQMFNGYYDVYPRWPDFRYAMAKGMNLGQFMSLLKMTLKSRWKASARFKALAT
jgi:glycosyltransferase involved in cell wall biosynthesis